MKKKFDEFKDGRTTYDNAYKISVTKKSSKETRLRLNKKTVNQYIYQWDLFPSPMSIYIKPKNSDEAKADSYYSYIYFKVTTNDNESLEYQQNEITEMSNKIFPNTKKASKVNCRRYSIMRP